MSNLIPNIQDRDAAASEVFALGIRYIQSAIHNRDSDPAAAQTAQTAFFDLLRDATIDVTTARYPSESRPSLHLRELNRQRQELWRLLNELERNSIQSETLSNLFNNASETYSEYREAVITKSALPSLRIREETVSRLIIHEEVPPDTLLLNLQSLEHPLKQKVTGCCRFPQIYGN
jgi:hypothetical protein